MTGWQPGWATTDLILKQTTQMKRFGMQSGPSGKLPFECKKNCQWQFLWKKMTILAIF